MINHGYKWSGIEYMTPDQWHQVRDNPRQRDTEKHAKKAKHLSTLREDHREVLAGRLPTGELIKIDGHTRDYLWHRNTPTGPAELVVRVYECLNINAAMDLYSTVDNPAAVEGATDQVYGALRELNVQFTSPLLSRYQFINALRQATNDAYGPKHGMDVNRIVKEWLPELKLLDLCNPCRDAFVSPTVHAALMTFRVHGESAISFWEAYANGKGELTGGYMNAVQALATRLVALKAKTRLGSGAVHREIVATCLGAYENRDKGLRYKAQHRGNSAIKPSFVALSRWVAMVTSASARRVS